jgi:hypothetical protein
VRAAIVTQHLSCRSGVAGSQCIDATEFHGIQPQRFGDAIHVHFHGELRLRRAEAAERAVGRSVREHRASVNVDVVATVGTSSMDASARQHGRTERDVRSPIEQHVDVHRDEKTVARHGGTMPHD